MNSAVFAAARRSTISSLPARRAIGAACRVQDRATIFLAIADVTALDSLLSPPVYAVVATKIRTSRSEAEAGSAAGRIYEGYMLTEPAIGRAMVLFRDLHGRRMITSPVRRVLRTDERQVFYIETENSVYRLRMEECLRGHQDHGVARSLTESARAHRG